MGIWVITINFYPCWSMGIWNFYESSTFKEFWYHSHDSRLIQLNGPFPTSMKTITSEETMTMVIREVFLHHNCSDNIISDHNPQFISKFWKDFLEMLKMALTIWTCGVTWHKRPLIMYELHHIYLDKPNPNSYIMIMDIIIKRGISIITIQKIRYIIKVWMHDFLKEND